MATSVAAPAVGAHQPSQPPQSSWMPNTSPPMQSPGVVSSQQQAVAGAAASPGTGASYFTGAKQSPTGQPVGAPLPQHQASTPRPPSASSLPNGVPPNLPAGDPQAPQRHPSQDLPNVPRQSATPVSQVRSDTPSAPVPLKDQAGTQQYTAIANLIKSAEPSVLRQAIRDHWEQCFLGSDYHLAFVVSIGPQSCLITWFAAS